MINSLFIALSFLTIIPFPERLYPDWTRENLRYFCLMLPLTGLIIFAPFWCISWLGLRKLARLSANLRGIFMTLLVLALTGGLHMDGFLDTCDAVFSHRDRAARLEILSDSHSGAFAVIGCVSVLMLKSSLFSELLLSDSVSVMSVALVPVFSRLGMGFMLSSLDFAKRNGLAVTLGEARESHDRYVFVMLFASLTAFDWHSGIMLALTLVFWSRVCKRLFGGITGDLLGAFVEFSEVTLLIGQVIRHCT